MAPRKLLCGQCLCGVIETAFDNEESRFKTKYRCAIDGQYRGKRTGCKLEFEQLMSVLDQLGAEIARRYPGLREVG